MAVPFPISGKVYNTDGTTPLANVLVLCKNVTNNEDLSQLSSASGDFIFEASNFTSGYSVGDEISLFASYGNYYTEEVFIISGGSKEQDLTLDIKVEPAALYCSIIDIREFTNISSSEFSDASVYDMIKRVTARIDELTGRTWKGIQTVTDEYYDGDDTDLLPLRNVDLQSVTAVGIDDNLDGVFTTVSPIYVKVYAEGYIILDRNAPITSWVAGPKNIKISYTYGNSIPTEVVRELAILMVTNLMHNDPTRAETIDQIFQKLRWSMPVGLA
jgi:hypothetical protein